MRKIGKNADIGGTLCRVVLLNTGSGLVYPDVTPDTPVLSDSAS